MANPRDFLEEDYEPKSKYKSGSPRDFLEDEPPESLGESALYALPRIGEDVLKAGYQGIQNIPGYWNKAKTEVPGYFNPKNWLMHPIERGGQSLAGLLELAQKINHTPHELGQYAANRLNLIPQEWANKIPQAPSLDEDIEKYIGQPKNPGDALSRGLARNADLLVGANALNKVMPHLTKRGATKKLRKAQQTFKNWADEKGLNNLTGEIETFFHGTPEESANKILEEGLTAPKYSQENALLTNKPEAAEAYGARINGGDEPGDLLRISIPKNKIENYLHPENTHWTTQSLKPRGHEDAKVFGIKQPIPAKYISKVGQNEPYHLPKESSKLNVNPELIEDARQFLPNTLKERHLLNNAANDYDKLFNLQSAVGKVSAKRMGKLSSIFSPETRIKGEAGLSARRKLINAMHENLQSEGLHDVSDLFREGQNDFRRYMKFRPYRNAIALAGLGSAGDKVFPQNPLTELMKKLMFHAANH